MKTITTITVLLLAPCVIRQVTAQGGSLTPPGAPAPTMKTLDKIEPRKELNSTNAPGDFLLALII